MIDRRINLLVVRVVGRYLQTAAVAEVSSLLNARYAVSGLVHHVITSLGVVLFNNLEATGTPGGSVGLAPLFQLVFALLRTIHPHVPSNLALHAEALSAVRTGNHDSSHSVGKDNEISTEDAGHPVSENSPIVEQVEALVLVLVEDSLAELWFDDGQTPSVVHRAFDGEHTRISEGGVDVGS